jgi:hypothetical protein
MRDKFEFREPLGEEPDGTYITAGQMQFYLNRPHGAENFKQGTREFFEYYNICRTYNVITDLMDIDPTVAIFYWDSKKEQIAMAFPATGIVAEALSTIEEPCTFGTHEDDEDEGWSDNPFTVG